MEPTKRAQSSFVGESVEISAEDDTGSVGDGGADDVATEAGGCALGKNSLVGHADGVVGDDRGVAELACRAGDDGPEDGGCLSIGESQGGGDESKGIEIHDSSYYLARS